MKIDLGRCGDPMVDCVPGLNKVKRINIVMNTPGAATSVNATDLFIFTKNRTSSFTKKNRTTDASYAGIIIFNRVNKTCSLCLYSICKNVFLLTRTHRREWRDLAVRRAFP